MRLFPVIPACLVLALVLAWGGCATPGKPGVVVVKPPFEYEPLRVRNACFVESVHLYDIYLAKHQGRADSWVRILEWGNQEGDFKISSGHAVALFQANRQMWIFDINFGFLPLKVPVERRADITDVTPEIFARYPQHKPVMARYRDDYPQPPAAKRPDFLFYHANPDVRDATHVANELGRFRPVNVIEFKYPENGQMQTSAAAVFIFGARVCIYFPRGGTHISNPPLRSVEDLNWVKYVLGRIYPGAQDVHVHLGGYLLFPPKN